VRASRLRELEEPQDTEDCKERGMKTDFNEHPFLRGHGRCRVCDLVYCREDKRERSRHRAFHKRYIDAAAAGNAPMPEEMRDQLCDEAGAVVKDPTASTERRLEAARKHFTYLYHCYLVSWISSGGIRMDPWDFYTARIEPRDGLGQFGRDAAEWMWREYSINSYG
jgi:hypothetical protein